MLLVWTGCIIAFFVLPFRLENRVMTLYGFMILVLFIATYCAGALVAARPQPQRPRPPGARVDFRLTDQILMIAGIIAIFAAVMDIQGRNILDLADAYQVRSDRAGALLAGSQSDSTIWFQLAFLTYPAGYVYLVREVAYRSRPVWWRAAAFGLAPVVITSLAMGGRAPLFYALLMIVFGFALRRQLFPVRPSPRAARARSRRPFKLGTSAKVGIAALGGIMLLYFVQVFFARADVAGGVEGMFGVASTSWGVNFNGRFSNVFFALLGPDGTYLVFVFVWYLVQGLVMSNAIFTDYNGSMMLGSYGVDLVAAATRRINGQFIADGYAVLLRMNTYGFLPSAFGSLYVDFRFFGLIPCFLWGWLSGKVYANVKRGMDDRWMLLVPFVTVGIFFSLINTPIGFSNGFVTHVWMIVAFLAAKVQRASFPPMPQGAMRLSAR
ncbi:hypothetical protein ASC65_06660 [Brevundimonas sp. Root1279]|nr:hypothetical protein ASC65_06660 [Brevundimonas sp. Root1279]